MFHELTIRDVRTEGDSAVALSFDLPPEARAAFEYIPGQYLTLRADIGGEDLRRSYSIASLPGEALTVGIKHVPDGRVSGHAQTLAPGARIQVMPPQGRFVWTSERNLLLIAAGSGITPMVSMAGAALAAGATVTLVYGNRTTGSIMFRDRLNALKDRYLDRFTLIHVLSRETQDVDLLNGRITGEKIRRLARSTAIDPESADGIFLCGPGDMIEDVMSALAADGISSERLHTERFTEAGDTPRLPRSEATIAAAEAGVTVEVLLDGALRRFAFAAEDDTVIDAAARQGLELPFSCKGGMCCTCRCKVTEGAADMAVNYSLEPWELEAGFMLACQARPTTDRLVLDFDAA